LLAWDNGEGHRARQTKANAAAEATQGEAADRAEVASTEATAATSSRAERIYVLTPQARVIELPRGATPIDFAYSLHTDLGHRCRGARGDGQTVRLRTQQQTGQTGGLIAAKTGGPSRDWLHTQLGALAGGRSRAEVRS